MEIFTLLLGNNVNWVVNKTVANNMLVLKQVVLQHLLHKKGNLSMKEFKVICLYGNNLRGLQKCVDNVPLYSLDLVNDTHLTVIADTVE